MKDASAQNQSHKYDNLYHADTPVTDWASGFRFFFQMTIFTHMHILWRLYGFLSL